MNLFEVFGLQVTDSYGNVIETTHFFDGTLRSTPNAIEDDAAETLKLLAQKLRGSKGGGSADTFLVSQLRYAQGVFVGAFGHNESLNIFDVYLEQDGGGK